MIYAEFGWATAKSRRWIVHATALFVLLIGGEEKSCDGADT
jgi:hypothetical protein